VSDLDTIDLAAVAAGFEDAHPFDILRWAGDNFGDELVITASFGDAVLVHLVSRAIPDAEVVLLDTGYLFAETMWFADQLRRDLGLNLRVVRPRDDVEVDQWQHDTDGCCAARKVEPLQRALAGRRAWVTGLRRADSPTRADAPIVHVDPFRGVTKINPLATWSDADVAHYSAIELLPEHPLAGHGYTSIGCWPCTRPTREGEDARAGRWSGTGRTECGLHVTGLQVSGLRGGGTP
jgi:phosphoadenosine phosphosulfate reductase